jgi:hypothetical protein
MMTLRLLEDNCVNDAELFPVKSDAIEIVVQVHDNGDCLLPYRLVKLIDFMAG